MNKRRTPQRAAIVEILRTSDRFRSAQEIHERLRSTGARVGLATVYRTLQALADDDQIDVLRSEGQSTYRLCDTESHHHHLVCTGCGISVEIANPALERWATSSARRHGFVHQSHTAEIFGLCRGCSN